MTVFQSNSFLVKQYYKVLVFLHFNSKYIIILIYIFYTVFVVCNIIANIQDHFICIIGENGNGDPSQGGGNPGGSPGGSNNPQEGSGVTLGGGLPRDENNHDPTNCSYMYTYANELLGKCGSGGAGPYNSDTITIFSNKFIAAMNYTGQGMQ
jgi:hypothetical protein